MKNIRETKFPSHISICCLVIEKCVLIVEKYRNLIGIRYKSFHGMVLQEIDIEVWSKEVQKKLDDYLFCGC